MPDLPSIRRAAVQAWLETVSGGSLVMFVPSPLTITILSRQLRWYLNTRVLVLLLVHAEVAGRRAGGHVHASLRQPILAWTRHAPHALQGRSGGEPRA